MEAGIAMRNAQAAQTQQEQVSTADVTSDVAAQSSAASTVRNTEVVLHTFESLGPQGFEPESGLVADSDGNVYGSTFNFGPVGARGLVYKVDRWNNLSILYAFTGGADGSNPTGDLVIDSAGNLYGTTVFGGNLSACSGQYAGCGVVFKLDKWGNETTLYKFKGGANGQNPYLGKLTMDSAGNLYGITSFGGNMSACGGQGCGVVFKLDKHGNETTLYAFNGTTDGAFPNGGLILDKAGNLYGTTRFGGNTANPKVCNGEFPGCGVVYKVDQSGHQSVLHTFSGGTDGALPYANLTMDGAGLIYGTASRGGAVSGCSGAGCGVVFKLDQSGNETILLSFAADANGGVPEGGVIFDKAGNLYGATARGGDLTACSGTLDSGCGVVFKLDKNGVETVLHTFTGGTDGTYPSTAVLLDNAGNLHGTTSSGGVSGNGAVYSLDSSGSKTSYTVYSFPPAVQGYSPYNGVVLDSAGNLYGVSGGGAKGYGLVYKLDRYGNETVLHTFAGGTDGEYPNGPLVLDNAGNIYGTAYLGGASNNGIVFKLDKSGKETVLYSFQGTADGAYPEAGLILDNAGNLYGTTSNGGNLSAAACSAQGGCGVVFKLDKTGKETVLYSFQGAADGSSPNSKLIIDNAGSLYGTTSNGGNLTSSACSAQGGCGVVFKLDKSNTLTPLYAFSGGADGGFPVAAGGLILDNAGNLYGTVSSGGNVNACLTNYPIPGCGLVFKVDPTGKETPLYSFQGTTDGALPQGSLLMDNAGSLYGTTVLGGNASVCSADGPVPGCGVVFKLNTSGSESVLYSFNDGADGANPNAGFVFDAAGNLYSTASSSHGNFNAGVVFKILLH